jgi:pilus assembly protein CpaF
VAAVDTVEAEVRELVRRRGLDPITDHAQMRRLVDEVVNDYDERAMTSTLAPLADSRQAARAVYDTVSGFGPLQRHLDDPGVEEIWINESGRVFVTRRGRSELTTTILNGGQVRDLVEKMLKTTGRRVDLSTPFAQPSQHAQARHDRCRVLAGRPDVSRRSFDVGAGGACGRRGSAAWGVGGAVVAVWLW